jgi:hypothetical protein
MVPSRAKGLHASFLGGESGRVSFHPIRFGIAIAPFSFSEDSVQETVAKTLHGFRDAMYFRNVDAGADDHAELS